MFSLRKLLHQPAVAPAIVISTVFRNFSRGVDPSLLKFNPPSREEIFSTYPATYGKIREAWVETLDRKEESRTGELIPLHPEVFSVRPRLDIISDNYNWQIRYKKVSYMHARTRHEFSDSNLPRPWPQKGMGKARHRSIRSPIWVNGGKAHGPQNPRSYFYMIPLHKRVNGLIQTLAVKFAQDDLHIVKDLEIPTDDPNYLEDLFDERRWGISALFVDVNDIMPENITLACEKIDHMNLMPAYGLNVHSMLKHSTLILTLDALNHIEDMLLFNLHRSDLAQANKDSMAVRTRIPMW